MARVFIDGFEAGSLGLWDSCTMSLETANPLDGLYSAKGYNGQRAQKNLPAALSELFVAFRFKATSISFTSRIFELRNGTTVVGSVELDGNRFRVLRGTATVLATGDVLISANNINLLEIRFKPADVGGIFQLKVNGVLDIDFTGDTTEGPTDIDNVRLYAESPSLYHYFDNVVIDDAEFPGNTRIAGIKPIGVGSTTQWEPLEGSNWDCVDEAPPSDSDYISTDIPDEMDLFAASDLPSGVSSVKCVQLQARAWKEGNSQNVQNLKLACRTSQTNYFSDNFEVQTSAKDFAKLWQTNPHTAQAWTRDEVNAMEIGVVAVA